MIFFIFIVFEYNLYIESYINYFFRLPIREKIFGFFIFFFFTLDLD